MITLQTNDNNDIFMDVSGNLAIAGGDLAAMQTVRHAVLTNKGELPLDQQAGVAYFDTVFCDTPNLEAFRQNVQQVAENVTEVQSVNDFELQNQDGILRYQMNITLSNGSEVTVNG